MNHWISRVTITRQLASWGLVGCVWMAGGRASLLAQGQMPATLTSGAVSLTASNAGTCSVSSSGCAVLAVSGLAHVWVQITGTFVGTLSFETTVDGTTWVAATMTPMPVSSTVTTATATGVWTGSAGKYYRVRMSAYTSGTALVTVLAKQN